MFEKEAEEWVIDNVCKDCSKYEKCKSKEHCTCKECSKEKWQKGAEFGYNKAKEEYATELKEVVETCNHWQEVADKANEWHFVKDGDYPKDDKQYLVLFFYNYKGKKEMSFGVRDNLHSDFEIKRCYTEQIIAWKEIVLPEGE